MAKYNFKTALEKIGRVVGSGRGMDYFKRAKGLFEDVKNDYSNPAMGKRRGRKRRSTPKMGRRRRRR